jgi:hypothetical protein
MSLDEPRLVEQLQAIRQLLAALNDQLAVVTERQQTLFEMFRRLQPAGRDGRSPEETAGTPAATPGQEVVAGCAQDILAVLREVGRPLTRLEVLEELVRRQLRWRENTVSHALVHLTEHGLVDETRDGGPHRYRLRPSGGGAPAAPGATGSIPSQK